MLEKKKNFWLVQTLNQVQGDGGIEVPEALEGWSLRLSKGRVNVAQLSSRTLRHDHMHLLWSCVPGSVEDYILLAQTLNHVQGVRIYFVCYEFIFSGRRESNKFDTLFLELGDFSWEVLGHIYPFVRFFLPRGRRESNKFVCLILGLRGFFLGEVRPYLPLRSLLPPFGRRELRAGSTPLLFSVTSLLFVLGFSLFVNN